MAPVERFISPEPVLSLCPTKQSLFGLSRTTTDIGCFCRAFLSLLSDKTTDIGCFCRAFLFLLSDKTTDIGCFCRALLSLLSDQNNRYSSVPFVRPKQQILVVFVEPFCPFCPTKQQILVVFLSYRSVPLRAKRAAT